MLYFYSQFDEFHSVIYSKLVTQEVNIRRIDQHPFGRCKVRARDIFNDVQTVNLAK